MKVILFADHEIGYSIVKKVINEYSNVLNIIAIITTIENNQNWWPSIATLLEDTNIPLLYFNSEIEDNLLNLEKADYFLLISWKFILNEELLSLPLKGTINLHYSLLPKYRGVYPVNWAIINGEDKTGITYHLVDNSIDGGNIVIQKSLSIDFYDTARTLQKRLDRLALEAFDLLLQELLNNKISYAINSNSSEYYSSYMFKTSNYIDLKKNINVREFINFLRGKTFYPEGRNAYFIDPKTGNKIYVSIILEPEV